MAERRGRNTTAVAAVGESVIAAGGQHGWCLEVGVGDGRNVGPTDSVGGQRGDGREASIVAAGKPVTVGMEHRHAEVGQQGGRFNSVHALSKDDGWWSDGVIASDDRGWAVGENLAWPCWTINDDIPGVVLRPSGGVVELSLFL
uniref:Uncharacterized protein n=1 Tax=Oryza nivara TaxID=4536 RepID=A0A0E0G3G3_ORYNI